MIFMKILAICMLEFEYISGALEWLRPYTFLFAKQIVNWMKLKRDLLDLEFWNGSFSDSHNSLFIYWNYFYLIYLNGLIWSWFGPGLVSVWSLVGLGLVLVWSWFGLGLVLVWSRFGPWLASVWSWFGPGYYHFHLLCGYLQWSLFGKNPHK